MRMRLVDQGVDLRQVLAPDDGVDQLYRAVGAYSRDARHAIAGLVQAGG